MNNIGIVLSGGGARGFAHLGFLKALDEFGIKICAISGVSAGGLVGALYSQGLTPDQIFEVGKKNLNFGFTALLLRRRRFLSLEFAKKILIEHIPHNSFEELKIPFFVNATDFIHNKSVFFSKGILIPRLIASASVPVIFSPVELETKKYVDGGLLDNFPVEPLITICDKIIGFHVNKLNDISGENVRLNRFSTLERCYHMSIANSVYSKVHLCDSFIEPELYQFGMFDTKKADKIFEIGYETTLKEKENLLKLLVD
ncbi:MAG: patatin-like phospholipase family protein [Ginsengibacter sp.]